MRHTSKPIHRIVAVACALTCVLTYYNRLQRNPSGWPIFFNSPYDQGQRRYFMEQTSGRLWRDDAVPEALQRRLSEELNDLALDLARVYHPGVEDKIRILVDPSLYAYVENMSVFRPTVDFPTPPELSAADTTEQDLWGRKYVSKRYQWLPSYFDVDSTGRVSIRSYVNGLSREEYPNLYDQIAELFGIFLPDIERVMEAVTVQLGDSSDRAKHSLANSSLQVVTRIADYELRPGQSHQGPWHVEGLPHENIIATAVYTLERSDNLIGGGIEFLKGEDELDFCRGECQDNSGDVNDALRANEVVETKQGRLIVFPNSNRNIHRVAHVRNKHVVVSGNRLYATRRAIIFFIVNPSIRILSTQEVEEQRYGSMPLDVVKELHSAQIKERIAYMKSALRLYDSPATAG